METDENYVKLMYWSFGKNLEKIRDVKNDVLLACEIFKFSHISIYEVSEEKKSVLNSVEE